MPGGNVAHRAQSEVNEYSCLALRWSRCRFSLVEMSRWPVSALAITSNTGHAYGVVPVSTNDRAIRLPERCSYQAGGGGGDHAMGRGPSPPPPPPPPIPPPSPGS